ncbi:hypothetical protein [Wenzhouxiangella marina]|uniref:Uncharacterized protein n=1 Tax=Wenzhouxiangella marina TaxID=1579979 RepID=A0A0K0XZA0_9GAMM|nr:hypothetical protein [Wenzhouxiangella marina]AKS43014.1 hypothetical protein WM2015_2656 [Wenzhouxiangella marina]MBB6087303.1 hypothetical protein [Wenzhouxiangella marina]
MKPSDEFDALGELWQSLNDGSARQRPPPDLARRRRTQRLILASELAVASAGLLVGLALILGGQIAIGLAALLYSLFGAAIGWKTRSMNIDALERSTRDCLDAQKATLKARRNHHAGGTSMLIAALSFYSLVQSQAGSPWNWMDTVLVGALIAGALFFLVRTIRSIQDLRRLEAQARSLKDEEPGAR